MKLGMTYLMLERFEEGCALLSQSVSLLRGADNPRLEVLGNALSGLCMGAAKLQRWDESQISGREALPLLRAQGSGTLTNQFQCLFFLSLAPQPPEAALQWLEEGLLLGRELVPDTPTATMLSFMLERAADNLVALGRRDAARDNLQEAVALWRGAVSAGDAAASASLARALYWLGRHWLDGGEAGRALEPLNEARVLLRSLDAADPYMLMSVLSGLYDAYRANPAAADAAAVFRREWQVLRAQLGGEGVQNFV